MHDKEGFERLLSGLDRRMALVTTSNGHERAGCLVGFHCQSSMEPPRYAVWLSKANHTFRVGVLAERFAVHFLGAADRDLAELFGGTTGDDVDKFARVDWEPGPAGVPLLARCPNRLVGRRTSLVDEGGDHVCVVLEPVAVTATGRLAPLWSSSVGGMTPGHEAGERPRPADEHAVDDPGSEPPAG